MHALIRACLEQRWLVLGMATMFVVWGARLSSHMAFDAFPEFAAPRIEVQTEAPGLSSEEIEALITTPIENALAGIPGLSQLRSKSVLGLSSIVLLFTPETRLLDVRMLAQERLSRVASQLPLVARAPVMLSPLSSTSRILKIGMWSGQRSQVELSDLARWLIRPRLLAIRGVANVSIWGERDRQLQVRVSPERLAAHEVSLEHVVAAAREAVSPRAGGLIDMPNQRLPVIHAPLIASASQLAQVPVQPTPARSAAPSGDLGRFAGSALTLGDVAEVVEDHALPIGEGLVTEGQGLLLVVEKQPQGNTLRITKDIDAALAELTPALKGIELDASIFRPAGFIERALRNLGEAMGIGCVLVIAVLFLFLWDVRTAIVSVTALPLSLFAATIVLTLLGRTIDTMVIAGLAIALGEVVDDAIIDVENIHRRLREARARETLSAARTLRVVLEASLEVRSAIVYASLIVVLVFVPVFLLEGVAGEFFRPLALAYGLAVLASMLVALTITPVLALLLLPAGVARNPRSPIADLASSYYTPVLAWLLKHPRAVLSSTALALVASAIGLLGLRAQFLPSFQENDFLMHWIAAPGTSLDAVARSAARVRAELLQVAGVRNFGAHIGRAEVGDEVVGTNFAELWISVDPAVDLPSTLRRVREVVDEYPGVYRDVQTYLQERMREVLSGGSGALVLRVKGPDLPALREVAAQLSRRIEAIKGVAHARPEAQVLVPQIEIKPDLRRCAALGFDPGALRTRAGALIQGERVGQILRAQQPIDVVVWGDSATRSDLAALRELPIAPGDQRALRLADVADVGIRPMPNVITHEAGSRKLDVIVDLEADADLAEVAAAIESSAHAAKFSVGQHIELLGEQKARTGARDQLAIASTFALIGIALILFADFGSLRLTSLVLASLPFALVGGVAAALLSGGTVSLGTLVGLVTVIGIAARNGIMLIAHLRQLEHYEGVPFGVELVLRGARERLSPIAMTALATGLALVPLVVRGNAPGHEIEHPMAVVILGGIVSSTMLNLLVLPVLYLLVAHPASKERDEEKRRAYR